MMDHGSWIIDIDIVYIYMDTNKTSGSVACKKHFDKYYWDVVDTNRECVEWLVNECKQSNEHQDTLFCQSSIDAQCKPCSIYLNQSIDKNHKCYGEMVTLCKDEKHMASTFCLEHSSPNITTTKPETNDGDNVISEEESRWVRTFYALFCKCNYLDSVNVSVLRRVGFIAMVVLITIFLTAYFD